MKEHVMSTVIPQELLRVTVTPTASAIGSLADNLRYLRYLEARHCQADIDAGCRACRRIGHPFTSACWL